MNSPAQPEPAIAAEPRQPLREEIAKLEIGHTHITRAAAWFLMVMFLTTIIAVPAAQLFEEQRQFARGERNTRAPQFVSILPDFVRGFHTFRATSGSWWRRLTTANDQLRRQMKDYEQTMEDQSAVAQATMPWTQFVLTALAGAGNERTYIGRDGWLFYRADVDYLTGEPFLDEAAVQRRRQATAHGQAVHADPRPAILDFHEQLARRGIALVVMPTPVKPSIHPEQLSSRYTADDAPIDNLSITPLFDELRRRGVLVFDPSAELAQAKRATGSSQYLATDTHWRPEAMEATARELAVFLEAHDLLAASEATAYVRERDTASNVGDVAAMLRLPPRQTLFPAEAVIVHPIVSTRGELWRPNPAAQLLVLGDSFSNIYSMPELGWGQRAGFVEQLSYELQQPVDCLTRNDGGALATRQMLARELARGRDRLAGKRVVVWQFAARELAQGDWQPVNLRLGNPPPREFLVAPEGEPVSVEAIVASISAVPRPGSVPYVDHVLCLHLTDIDADGHAPGSPSSAFRADNLRAPGLHSPQRATRQAVVYLWSMRRNVLQPAALLRPGERVRIRLHAWADVAERYDAINRSELDDEALQLEQPNWGEIIP